MSSPHPASGDQPSFLRIALVADKKNWALHSIARHIKSGVEQKYPVTIDILFVQEFASEAEFLDAMKAERYDLVHFMWRRFLVDIFNCFVSAGRRSDLARFLAETAISFTICDHLYCEPEDILADSHIFQMADGYATVSKALHELYASQLLLPRPGAVLHDRTDLIANLTARPKLAAAKSAGKPPLRVVWAGNSAWGQWLGLDDTKGLRVIHAALDKVRQLGRAVEYVEFDASKAQAPSEQVGEALLAADVLLCASETESTPLPVLEAMAAGCAIVTTDVGVVREALPSQQDSLIVARDVEAFAAALLRCADDLEWTRRLGDLNRAAMKEWCAKPLADDWMRFFESAYRSSRRPEKIDEKHNIVRSFVPDFLDARYNSLRYLIRKSAWASSIASRLAPHARPLLARIAAKLSHGQRARRLRNFRAMLRSKFDRSGDMTLALYTPMWLGIAASTRSLFENAFPIPAFSHQRPWMVSEAEIEEYCGILDVLSPRRLIVSGGERLHREIAVRYRRVRPDAQIEVLWHGSQLQWSDSHERDLFQMWLDEYHAGTIGKFWILKQGLDDLLNSQGIAAELIENGLSQRIRKARRLAKDEPIKVGIWLPRSDDRKNPISQFLAFAGDERFKVYHALEDQNLLDLLDRWRVPHVRVAKGSIPHRQLLAWMGWMDVNLYVSLSECSPMTPLESIAAGVPVVVGPTTTFFDDDPLLRRRLVVPSPEQMSSIRQTVEELCSDYDAVADAVVRLGIRREAQLTETRRRLRHGLTVLSSDKRLALPPRALDERDAG